jgi:hypothetical protein
MAAPFFFFLVLCTILPFPSSAYIYSPSLEEQEIEVTTNPHIFQDERGAPPLCSLDVQHLLSPHLLMTHLVPTQQDTFLNIRHAKVFTQPVPVYTMKQPARLNPAELKFDLVLVRDLMTHDGVMEIPVDLQASMDSWFPEHHWTPIVHKCTSSDAPYQHVGWKFARDSGETFYALLVQVDERRQHDPILVRGFKAAAWMMERIMS